MVTAEGGTLSPGPFAHTTPGDSGGSGVLPWIRLLAAEGLLYATEQRGPQASIRAVREAYSDPEAALVAMWAIAGQLSGHEWCVCGVCGTPRLTKPSEAKPPRCTLTPGCQGHLMRVAARPRMTKPLKLALLGLPLPASVSD